MDHAGTHTIVGKSPLFASAAAQQQGGEQSVSSSAHLFSSQGFPTRITVLSSNKARAAAVMTASTSSSSCSIQGFKVEHALVRSLECIS